MPVGLIQVGYQPLTDQISSLVTDIFILHLVIWPSFQSSSSTDRDSLRAESVTPPPPPVEIVISDEDEESKVEEGEAMAGGKQRRPLKHKLNEEKPGPVAEKKPRKAEKVEQRKRPGPAPGPKTAPRPGPKSGPRPGPRPGPKSGPRPGPKPTPTSSSTIMPLQEALEVSGPSRRVTAIPLANETPLGVLDKEVRLRMPRLKVPPGRRTARVQGGEVARWLRKEERSPAVRCLKELLKEDMADNRRRADAEEEVEEDEDSREGGREGSRPEKRVENVISCCFSSVSV